jgi:pentapeptide MXKDX repeat protein
MTIRLLLAVTVAAGLIFAPAAFAQDTIKPAMKPGTSKSKTHQTAKVHKKTDGASRSSGRMQKKNDMMGAPYSTQKDEMTR